MPMDIDSLEMDDAAVDDVSEGEGDGEDALADVKAYLETDDTDEIDAFVAAVKAAMGAPQSVLAKTLLATFETVVDRADLGGQTDDVTGRHPKASVLRDINDSYRSIRTWSITEGFREFIVPGAETPLPSAPETGETYSVVPLPLGTLSLQGVDVLVNGGRWERLEPVDWESRRRLQRPRGGNGNGPIWFALRSLGSVVGSEVSEGTVALFPFSSNGSYRLFTLPEWDDVTEDEDVLIFPSQAWFDAVTYEVAHKLVALNDGDSSRRATWLQAKLDEAKQAIQATIPKIVQSGPMSIRRDRNYRSGSW